MIFPSIGNAIAGNPSILTQSVSAAAATNGTGVDVSGYEGVLLIQWYSGAANTTDTVAITVEESSDNSTFTAVPADALINVATGAAATFTTIANTATTAHKHQVLGLKKERVAQYVRVVATKTGTAGAIVIGASIWGAKKYA